MITKFCGKRKANTNNSQRSKTINGKVFQRKSQTAKRNLITGSSSSSRRRLTFNDVVTSGSHIDEDNDDIYLNVNKSQGEICKIIKERFKDKLSDEETNDYSLILHSLQQADLEDFDRFF